MDQTVCIKCHVTYRNIDIDEYGLCRNCNKGRINKTNDIDLVQKYKLCPFCGEKIKGVAIKCRFCKEMLDEKVIHTNTRLKQDQSRPSSLASTVKKNDIALTAEERSYIYSFSFSAMLGIPWWSLYMRYYFGLFWLIPLFIPFAAPVVAIIFGGFARRLAWKNYPWSTFDEFKQRNGRIDSFTVGLFIISLIASIFLWSLSMQSPT